MTQKDQNEIFSRKATNKIFMYLLAPFIMQNFEKLLEQIHEDKPFSGPKWPICPEQIFLVQTITITFIYLLTLFIVQNYKKILTTDPELRGCPFVGPKWFICPKFFFGKN